MKKNKKIEKYFLQRLLDIPYCYVTFKNNKLKFEKRYKKKKINI